MKKILTLCLISQNSKVLLGMKKLGHGVGKWNGFGGKVEAGEIIENAAKREVYEEAGIQVKDLEKCGVIEYEIQNNPQVMEVHIFRSSDFLGEPKETEEMNPLKWFNINRIPFDKMWPNDKLWFSLLLGGKKIKGNFVSDSFGNTINYDLQEVENF